MQNLRQSHDHNNKGWPNVMKNTCEPSIRLQPTKVAVLNGKNPEGVGEGFSQTNYLEGLILARMMQNYTNNYVHGKIVYFFHFLCLQNWSMNLLDHFILTKSDNFDVQYPRISF